MRNGLWSNILRDCPLTTLKWMLTCGKEHPDHVSRSYISRLDMAIYDECGMSGMSRRALSQRRDIPKLNKVELIEFRWLMYLYDDARWTESLQASQLATFLYSQPHQPYAWNLTMVWKWMGGYVVDFSSREFQHLSHIIGVMMLADPFAIDHVLIPPSSSLISQHTLHYNLFVMMVFCAKPIKQIWNSLTHRWSLLYWARVVIGEQRRRNCWWSVNFISSTIGTPLHAQLYNTVPEWQDWILDLNVYARETDFLTPFIADLADPQLLQQRLYQVRRSPIWNQCRQNILLFTPLLPPIINIVLDLAWPRTLETLPIHLPFQ